MDTFRAVQALNQNVQAALTAAGETENSLTLKTGLPRSSVVRHLKGSPLGLPAAHIFIIANALNTTASALTAVPSSFYRPTESAVN